MWSRVLVWLACLFFTGLLGPASVFGQEPPLHCVRPLPGVSAQNSVFVSPQGNLCRSLESLTADTPEAQVAVGRTPEPGKAFLFSAVLPGAGQWFLDQDRWPVYLAVELWAWLQFFDWRREGTDLQDDYKDLAWYVAQRVSTGPRTDAGWEYYESLTRFNTSGAFDADPLTPGIQPETDSRTYNGSIWALAQGIYIPEDPENPVEEGSDPYERALAYYSSRAYGPELAWKWGVNVLHQEEYASLIRDSDEALRNSTSMIGVIIANHVLSAVDALVSGRLGIAGQTEPTLQFSLLPGLMNTRAFGFRVRLPTPLSHVP